MHKLSFYMFVLFYIILKQWLKFSEAALPQIFVTSSQFWTDWPMLSMLDLPQASEYLEHAWRESS
jgi:hypothetical protein